MTIIHTEPIRSELNNILTYEADGDGQLFSIFAESWDVDDDVAEIWFDRQAEDRLLSSLLARKAAREAQEV